MLTELLLSGKYFGEIALLSFEGNNRRTADVRSVGYSELLVLSKKALMSVSTSVITAGVQKGAYFSEKKATFRGVSMVKEVFFRIPI